MLMELKELERTWNEFGKRDPFWAILTRADKKNNRWQPDEFFDTGREEIEQVLAGASAWLPRQRRGKALDFGCGVGRLTQALCRHFAECHGVDIADSMIELARRYNQFGDRCYYHVNRGNDLALFANNTFDFIYTTLVLQHMSPVHARRYIEEFLRVLAPGGLLVFQIPSEVVITPLPTSGFQARITVPRPPRRLQAGRKETLLVRVKNAGDVTWPADPGRCIRLANHWLHADGHLYVLDDGRTPLPQDVEPGQQIELTLKVTCPPVHGRYLLEIDMVQEMVGWFSQCGATTTARLPVTVGASLYQRVANRLLRAHGPSKNSTGQTPWEPSMMMSGIPRDQVVELVRSHGGKVLEIVEEDKTGNTWRSFNYWVTR
jgi:SAM-dependent methyltransferase